MEGCSLLGVQETESRGETGDCSGMRHRKETSEQSHRGVDVGQNEWLAGVLVVKGIACCFGLLGEIAGFT